MKLKTSELMESNHDEKGKTPTDNNHGFTEASNVVLKTMQEENHWRIIKFSFLFECIWLIFVNDEVMHIKKQYK